MTLCLSVSAKEIRFDILGENEGPYMFDKTETGDDQTNMDVPARFADNERYWIYKVTFDATDSYAFMSINLGNDFLCEVSVDDKTYEAVLKDENNTHDHTNLKRYNIDLSKYLKDNAAKTLYIQFTDNTPEDGWGSYTFGQVAFYSSDKEFTVTETVLDKSVEAVANLEEYTSLAFAAPVEAASPAEETPAAADSIPEATPEPVSVPKTGDGLVIFMVAALVSLSVIIVAAKRQKSK